jgi:hypothetical protein
METARDRRGIRQVEGGVEGCGQALVPTIVAKRQGILDESLYNAARNGDPFSDEVGDTVDTAVVDPSAAAAPAAAPEGRHLADAKA